MGAAAAPEPNLVLAGRYRLDERLGAGGMGTIWRGEHLVLKAPVAIKLLERDAPPDEDTVARFLREAQAAAALRSPHVVQILDYGVDGRWPFIVMELLEGETLAQRLKRKRRLSAEETLRILSHVARAMSKAHEAGIVHRDLKPENVFLVRNEDEEIAKVLDFGVAKVSSTALGSDSARTRTGSILGTPYYMSPEQAQGNKAVDHRSDLWALGVIAFEALTGTRPFYSDGLGDLVLAICVRDIPVPSTIAPVPIGFDAWFARAVSRDIELRFQSAREMIEALREALGLERERGSDPEIFVSSAEARPVTSEPSPTSVTTPNSQVPTVVASLSATPASSPAAAAPHSQRFPSTSPNAPTVLADALEPEAPPRPSLFDDLPPPPKSPLVPVFGVALGALLVGLAVGLWVLDREAPSAELTTVTKGAAPLPQVTAPRAQTTAPVKKKTAASAESARPEPKSTISAAPSASSAAAPPAASSAAPRSPAPQEAKPAASAPSPSEVPASPPASASAEAPAPQPSSSTWVKPAWAIPDEDGPRRVPPIEEARQDP